MNSIDEFHKGWLQCKGLSKMVFFRHIWPKIEHEEYDFYLNSLRICVLVSATNFLRAILVVLRGNFEKQVGLLKMGFSSTNFKRLSKNKL